MSASAVESPRPRHRLLRDKRAPRGRGSFAGSGRISVFANDYGLAVPSMPITWQPSRSGCSPARSFLASVKSEPQLRPGYALVCPRLAFLVGAGRDPRRADLPLTSRHRLPSPPSIFPGRVGNPRSASNRWRSTLPGHSRSHGLLPCRHRHTGAYRMMPGTRSKSASLLAR